MGNGLLILGSASPRRRELLSLLGVSFDVLVASVDEAGLVDADVVASVERTSIAKFEAFAAAYPELVGRRQVLTADTLVAGPGAVLGKPGSDAEAEAMVRRLSSQELTIASAVCFGAVGATPARRTVTTTVRLRSLTDAEIAEYVATGAAADKAGALELQGRAASFIDEVDGCWSNVVGLPLCATAELVGDAVSDGARWTPCSGRDCGPGRG